MFRILKDPSFDFMGRRNVLLAISAVLIVASAIVLWVNGVNPGVEFTGGAELQLKFAQAPDVAAVRSSLAAAGMPNTTVTTIGDAAENEIYIRMGAVGGEDASEDLTSEVVRVLRERFGGSVDPKRDLNILDEARLAPLLEEAPGMASRDARSLAAAMLAHRKEVAIFHAFDDLSGVDGMSHQTLEFLRGAAFIGPLALRSQSYIWPAVGRELMQKAMFAIVGSLIGMLVYIWIRFQLQWGFAAVVALTHDTLITLGLFSIFGKEMTLPVVAAFLTLIGYSVNDTVVVFDRIRENLRVRGTEGLESVINLSLNQTLSRTIITSGLTWIVVFGLYLFGGAALNPFSFVLSVGVVVGTYSSIYIASPFLVVWKKMLDARKQRAAEAPGGRRRSKGKKLRTPSTG